MAFAQRNGCQWLTIFLALQKLGVVALPLDASLPPSRWPDAARELGAHWLWSPDGKWEALSVAAPRREGDVCLLKTTSGTSGQPRPLPFTSASMLADGRQIAATMRIGPGDRNLGAIPLGHSYGLGNLVLPLIAQGTPIVASTEILPDALAAQIERFAQPFCRPSPPCCAALAESSVEPSGLRSLRRVISAGAPLRPRWRRPSARSSACPIQNFYGSSETGGICFDRTGEATATGRSVGAAARRRGRAAGRGRPRDGPQRRPSSARAEHTLADLGAWNERGELVLTGRATPLANIGGKKVAPLEIERLLRGLDGVTDAWVGVQARALGGEDFLLAAVETARTRAEVRRALAERAARLAGAPPMVGRPALPRTARGKLDRQELEARCARD